jgi:hypothetical protein
MKYDADEVYVVPWVSRSRVGKRQDLTDESSELRELRIGLAMEMKNL